MRTGGGDINKIKEIHVDMISLLHNSFWLSTPFIYSIIYVYLFLFQRAMIQIREETHELLKYKI